MGDSPEGSGTFVPGFNLAVTGIGFLAFMKEEVLASSSFAVLFTKSLSGFRERILRGIFQNRISVFFVCRRNSGIPGIRYFLKKAHAGLKIEAGE